MVLAIHACLFDQRASIGHQTRHGTADMAIEERRQEGVGRSKIHLVSESQAMLVELKEKEKSPVDLNDFFN